MKTITNNEVNNNVIVVVQSLEKLPSDNKLKLENVMKIMCNVIALNSHLKSSILLIISAIALDFFRFT